MGKNYISIGFQGGFQIYFEKFDQLQIYFEISRHSGYQNQFSDDKILGHYSKSEGSVRLIRV